VRAHCFFPLAAFGLGEYLWRAVASHPARFFLFRGYLRLQVAIAFVRFCFFVHFFSGAPKEEEQAGGFEPDEEEGEGVRLPSPVKVADDGGP